MDAARSEDMGITDDTRTEELAPESTEAQPAPPATAPEGAPEPAAPEQAEETEAQKEEHRRSAQARINQLVAKQREAERRAERLERELQELKARPPAPAHVPEGKPTPDKFDTWEAYLDARDEWNRKEWERGLEKREQERQAQQAIAAEEAKWADRRATFETMETEYRRALGERAADYDAVTEAMTPFLVTPDGYFTNADLARALFEAGPEVVHYFGQHLDKLSELVKSDPLTIGREVGRAEKAVKDRGREGRRFSQAPPPPPAVGGGGVVNTDPSKMSDAEYRAWRLGDRK